MSGGESMGAVNQETSKLVATHILALARIVARPDSVQEIEDERDRLAESLDRWMRTKP